MEMNVSQESKRTQAPGPKGHFLLGSLAERKNDPLTLFLKSAQEYGPVVNFKMGPRTVVLVNDSESIRHVLMDSGSKYIKGFGYDKLQAFLGNGLLTNEGDSWRRQRKLAQPAFHRASLVELSKQMLFAAKDWARTIEAKLPEQKVFNIHDEMMALTQRIVSLTLLGTDITRELSTDIGEALNYLIEEANRRVLDLFPIPTSIPTRRNLKSKEYISKFDSVIMGIIEEHRKNPSQHKTLLSMLISATDEETGQGMSDKQLRDEVITFFVAGHETTANALTWTLYLMSKYPHEERKILEESERILGGKDMGFENLSEHKYLMQVIEESMRLYPPAWIVSREAVVEDEILGYKIKPGNIVVLSPWVMHRSTEHWENPEGFDPERFTEEKKATREKFAYFPFGGGPRSCIGNHFALMELQIVLGTVLKNLQFSLVPGFKVELEPLITLRPKWGMQMIVRKR